METKALEIRDEGTFIAALAVNMNPSLETPARQFGQRYLLRRCGYRCDDRPNILLTHLAANGTPAWNDPYAWGGRTWPVAHKFIIEHWAILKDGDVIDVQYILGETAEPKKSERETAPL